VTPPDARGLLRAAADRLDAVAGLLASRPEVVAALPGGGTEHVAEARARSAEWIVTLSPVLAGPLAAWLRAAADDPRPPLEALAVAQRLLPPDG
jgi:hypothetical protein